ncbi:NAD-binding lipoprotein [Streptomyces sp. NPDC090106]|uniref:CASTOR/POLLUX-related putative ion channel n=1 Tax=Streptomyces sp. NPDC090106 TaxID=3365946 RepID=UPI00382B563A
MADAGRRQGTPLLRDRARYLFDRTLARSTAALLGWLALGCMTLVVPVSALLVWTDPRAPHSVAGRISAVWRTSAETMRLSGVTGAPLRMLLAAVLGLIALLCVSTVVGVITTGLGDRLAELRRGRSTVLEQGHTVVLGWSDQVFTVVAELFAARDGKGRHVVTVLADRDSADMHTELTTALGIADASRLVCRTGAPTDPEALALVTPGAARSVLILPRDDEDADARVIRTLLALRALLGTGSGDGTGSVPRLVATVRDGHHLRAARLAAGPGSTVLEADRTTARLLVQSARQPGLPAALRDLLDFSGAEFHTLGSAGWADRTYDELVLSFEDACVVGILRADGTPLLTPPPHTVLRPGDRLVTVAHDDEPAAATDCRGHIDAPALAPAGERTAGPARTLMLGWNRRAPFVVDLLRQTSRPGSVLDVVTDPDTDPPAHLARSDTGGRLRVSHRTGDPTRFATLRALHPSRYDSVIVLRDENAPAPAQPDDKTLLTLLMLKAHEEEAGRRIHVVAELHDHRSRPLAPLGAASDVVVRGELTALLMTQISHDPALGAVFEEIFTARGGALALRPATDYVRPGLEASFATVTAAALARGEAAIGYRTHDPSAGPLPPAVRLCPGQSRRRSWSDQDEILVLAPGHGITPADDGEPLPLPLARHPHQDGDPAAEVPS